MAMAGLDGGRLSIGACSLGAAQASFEIALQYTKVECGCEMNACALFYYAVVVVIIRSESNSKNQLLTTRQRNSSLLIWLQRFFPLDWR